MKWSISCHISKQGCHSHQQFQASKYELLALEVSQKGEQSLWSWSCWLLLLPKVNEELRMWKTKKPRNRKLALDSWDAYERNNFSEPRSLHLPIHRKALNSVTWDIWFSLVINNLLIFRLPAFYCKLLYNLSPSLTPTSPLNLLSSDPDRLSLQS